MMEFHPGKCQVMSITRKRHPLIRNYLLHGTVLERVKSAKYLGVNLSDDLRWNQHVDAITAKASRSLGFLRRNLQVKNEKLKTNAFFSLVRPQLEYASTVWDPHTAANINKIEMVQRRAARYVKNRWYYKSSVGNMLQELGWATLAQRREQARLSMMYKIHHGLVCINQQFQFVTPMSRSSRDTHADAYHLPYSRTEFHAMSFFPRTVPVWNSLPGSLAQAKSLEAYRAGIAAHLSTEMP